MSKYGARGFARVAKCVRRKSVARPRSCAHFCVTRDKNGTTPSVDPIDVVVEHVVRATVRAWLTQGKRGHEGCAAQHLSEVEHLVQLLGRVRVLGHEGDAVLVPRPDARVARLARPHVLDKDGLLMHAPVHEAEADEQLPEKVDKAVVVVLDRDEPLVRVWRPEARGVDGPAAAARGRTREGAR